MTEEPEPTNWPLTSTNMTPPPHTHTQISKGKNVNIFLYSLITTIIGLALQRKKSTLKGLSTLP